MRILALAPYLAFFIFYFLKFMTLTMYMQYCTLSIYTIALPPQKNIDLRLLAFIYLNFA